MRINKDAEQRREEFIDAAEKLFQKNGIVDTTVNAIVKEVDVAKGLFYYYFKSKDDVIDAISEKYNKDFKRTIEKAVTGCDFEDRLEGFVENSVASFRILWDKLHGGEDGIDLTILSKRSMDEAKKTASEALEKLLEEGNRIEKFDIEVPKYYARMLISGIADLATQGEATAEEIKKMIMDLIEKSERK